MIQTSVLLSPNLINLMSVWTLISNVCVGGSQFSCDIPIKMARVDKVRVLLSNGSGCAATETVQSKMHCNLTIVETRGEVCVSYDHWRFQTMGFENETEESIHNFMQSTTTPPVRRGLVKMFWPRKYEKSILKIWIPLDP